MAELFFFFFASKTHLSNPHFTMLWNIEVDDDEEEMIFVASYTWLNNVARPVSSVPSW